MKICFENLSAEFESGFQLTNINWQVISGQHWIIVGPNGSGKSALASLLAGAGDVNNGTIKGLPNKVGVVSAHAQAELIAAELKKDDADILDVISQGTPASKLIDDECTNHSLKKELVKKLGFTKLLDKSFRNLSSGETRKLLLLRAIASEPEILVLDEPFSGLDRDSRAALKQSLNKLAKKVPMVFVLNRVEQCPDYVSNIAYMEQGQLLQTFSRNDELAYGSMLQLMHLKTTDLVLPQTDPTIVLPALDSRQPLVRLTNASIQYTDNTIFAGLNWTIHANQHWQISGKNGSGKTSLLALISGDHPQCYSNDILVFGHQRGSGESIWQIKQHIGFVSSALLWEYRVSISARNVIISGFYDSIGLYAESTQSQQAIADQWLSLLGMNELKHSPFSQLSHGQKRLLLIARAMVKHPPLLILDEPCLGLDEMNRQLVIALIERICATGGTSVLYVSHQFEDQITAIDNTLNLDEL